MSLPTAHDVAKELRDLLRETWERDHVGLTVTDSDLRKLARREKLRDVFREAVVESFASWIDGFAIVRRGGEIRILPIDGEKQTFTLSLTEAKALADKKTRH